MRGTPVLREKPKVGHPYWEWFQDWLKEWWVLGLPLLSWGLIWIAGRSPQWVESWYSTKVYLVIATCLGAVTSLFPFSLMELGILAALVAVVVLAVLGMIGKLRFRWKKLLKYGMKLACVLVLAFTLLCGLNYYRPELSQLMGMAVMESPVSELEGLCQELAQKANTLREQLDQRGQVMALKTGNLELMDQARETMGSLSQNSGGQLFPKLPIKPKPVLNSWWMSMLQLTGIYCPWTAEANVNVAAPDYSIPSTTCHELAHTCGFMREDEANFIAYLACQESPYLEFQYSGVMLALLHATNRLYSADAEGFSRVWGTLSPEVLLDFADNNDYWAKREGPVAEISDAVNDVYLKVNAQSDGVQSYGRMVDLLLADYRQRNGIL